MLLDLKSFSVVLRFRSDLHSWEARIQYILCITGSSELCGTLSRRFSELSPALHAVTRTWRLGKRGARQSFELGCRTSPVRPRQTVVKMVVRSQKVVIECRVGAARERNLSCGRMISSRNLHAADHEHNNTSLYRSDS